MRVNLKGFVRPSRRLLAFERERDKNLRWPSFLRGINETAKRRNFANKGRQRLEESLAAIGDTYMYAGKYRWARLCDWHPRVRAIHATMRMYFPTYLYSAHQILKLPGGTASKWNLSANVLSKYARKQFAYLLKGV